MHAHSSPQLLQNKFFVGLIKDPYLPVAYILHLCPQVSVPVSQSTTHQNAGHASEPPSTAKLAASLKPDNPDVGVAFRQSRSYRIVGNLCCTEAFVGGVEWWKGGSY